MTRGQGRSARVAGLALLLASGLYAACATRPEEPTGNATNALSLDASAADARVADASQDVGYTFTITTLWTSEGLTDGSTQPGVVWIDAADAQGGPPPPTPPTVEAGPPGVDASAGAL